MGSSYKIYPLLKLDIFLTFAQTSSRSVDKRIAFVLFLLATLPLSSQSIRLSPHAEIMALTCGPSVDELYAAFGHSAFRVYDPENDIDWIYNYGTFDFNQPNFYLNFARGHLLYMLSRQDYQRFKNAYIYFNRSIYEQVLNLTPEQKQRLFEFLEENQKPENRFYLYDYFYDNCASRLRDVLKQVFADTVRFTEDHITTHYSFRELVDIYTKDNHKWGDLGIDLCLGMPMDKILDPDEYMFLPDYIYQHFEEAYLMINGEQKPLVSRTIVTYESYPEEVESSFFSSPSRTFWLIFLLFLVVTSLEVKYKKHWRLLDITLFSLFGLLGVFLLFLWFGTDHASQYNFNLLWAFPPHLVTGLMLIKKRPGYNVKRYFLFSAVLMVLIFLFWPFLPQKLNLAFIPVILIMLMRSVRVYLAI